jgi:hypothetical protein
MITTMHKKRPGSKSRKRAKNASSMTVENSIGAGDVMSIPQVFEARQLATQIYRFRQWDDLVDAVQTPTTVNTGQITFQAGLVDGFADLASVFDMYRVDLVRLTFRPRFKTAQVVALTSVIMPSLYTVIDYVDSSSALTLATARQYESLKVTEFDSDHVRCLTPASQGVSLDGSSALTQISSDKFRWFKCTSQSAELLGVKWLIEAGATGQTALQSWKVQVEYFLSFRCNK